MNTVKIEKGNALMVAHRGVSGLETENTLAAFIAAGNRTYWGVETDVHPTADGELILIHDSNTKRVCGDEMIVEETDSSVLKNLQVKDFYGEGSRSDLRLPTLREYIRLCKKYEKICVLELKEIFREEHVVSVLKVVEEENYAEGMVYITFHAQNLVFLRKHAPNTTVQFLAADLNEEIFELAKTNKYDLDIRFDRITEEWVKRLHEAGIILNCWTVNDREIAERLISWGVDMITTNILE